MVNPVTSPADVQAYSAVPASTTRQPAPTRKPEISSAPKAQPVAADTVRISAAGAALHKRQEKRP